MAAGLLLALVVPMWLANTGQDATAPPADPPVSVAPEPAPSDTPEVDVTVRVSSGAGAQPAGGARVEFVHARTGATVAGTADGSGSVTLAGLSPGDYRVSVSVDGRVALTRDVQVEGTETIELDLDEGAP
jgi:hypothetical protein